MIKILIGDDHAIFREGLKRIVEEAEGLQVVGEAGSGQEILELARTVEPDVVLLDISMPGRGGLETAQELKRLHPQVRILVLTVHPEDHFAVRCLKEGADGYMTKDAAPQQLVQAIRKVRGGGKYVSPNLAELLAMSLGTGFMEAAHENLSDREFQVLLKIGEGMTVGKIAAELGLSVKTISTYRARIMEKMNMRNNAEIVLYVVRNGLLGE
jgi:two-component system, NarL family, invasion response regulator UvrY